MRSDLLNSGISPGRTTPGPFCLSRKAGNSPVTTPSPSLPRRGTGKVGAICPSITLAPLLCKAGVVTVGPHQRSNIPLFLLMLLSGLFACQPISSVPPERPNIIFIMADDLGYGDLGAYGQQVIQTPRLDQFAREGKTFWQVYAGSPVCAPSRSVLMTGQHSGHTTVRGNFGQGGVVGLGGGAGRVPLEQNDTTLAEVLKSAGYITGMAGKWGLGEPSTTGEPLQQGFDEFLGFLNQRKAHSYFPDFIWHNDQKLTLDENQAGQQGTYVQDLIADFTLDFVRRHQDTSFFLYYPLTLPHDRYEIPSQGLYAHEVAWTEEERTFAAMVSRMDTDVGRLLDLLEELSLAENTLVLFCSDNGAAEFWKGRFNSSGALRGRKRDLYEGGIRTPMIVRYPGRIQPGSESDFPWHFMDVLPTLATIAEAQAPRQIDGRDISPVFWNENGPGPEPTFYWEFYEGGFQQAVRWQNWKGVKLASTLPWELYDLATDPAESTDVAATHPEIVKQLNQIAETAHTPSPYFSAQEPNQD